MIHTLFAVPVDKIFKKNKIEASYLFGSRSLNKENNESDYDIAFLVKDKTILNYRDFISQVGRAFFNPEKLHISLVDLTHTSPILLYQIIKNGTILYEKRKGDHILIESLIMRIYFDDQYRSSLYFNVLDQKYEHR